MMMMIWLQLLLLVVVLIVGCTHGFSPQPAVNYKFPSRWQQRQQDDNKSYLHHPATSSQHKQQQTASSNKSTSRRRQDKISSLLDWSKKKMDAGGANIQVAPSIRLAEDSDSPAGCLGWFATAAIPSGSVVLAVPISTAITINKDNGPDTDGEFSRVMLNRNGRKLFRDMPWFCQAALYMVYLDQQVDWSRENTITTTNDNTSSKKLDYRPWLNCLPRELDTPIHWDSHILADELQYDYMVKAVERQRTSWKAYHATLVQYAASADVVWSWDDFLWGSEIARSRAFSGTTTSSSGFNPWIYAFTSLLVAGYVGLELGTLEQAANGAGVVLCASIFKDFVLPKLFKSKTYIICPMIDMANHKSSSSAVAGQVSFEYFNNAYSLSIQQAVAPGDQVYISYGQRSNDQLLQYYGFVELDNPHDVYVMPPLREWDINALEQACGRTFAPGRLEKLDRAGLLGSIREKSAAGDDSSEGSANLVGGVVLTRLGGMDQAMLQALRALVSTNEEWEAAGQAIGNFVSECSGGAENEKCARLAAAKAIEMELTSKATTIEQDEVLLKRMEVNKMFDASRADMLAVQFRIEKKKLLLETIQKLV
jgi:hypothetical protein